MRTCAVSLDDDNQGILIVRKEDVGYTVSRAGGRVCLAEGNGSKGIEGAEACGGVRRARNARENAAVAYTGYAERARNADGDGEITGCAGRGA